MSFPGTTIEERFVRAAIRFCSVPSGGPAWDAASSYYDDLIWYLLNFPKNTATTPPLRLYCDILEADILSAGSTATGLTQGGQEDNETDFDFLGRLLNAEIIGS